MKSPTWATSTQQLLKLALPDEIVNGRRGITPSTALRLAKAFSTSPQLWLNGQLALDLYRASHDEDELRQLERIEPVAR